MKRFLSIVIILLWIISYSKWIDFVTLDSFKKEVFDIDKIIRKNNEKNINIKFKKILNTKKCNFYNNNKWYYFLNPICLYKKKYPKIPFRKAVDYIWPYVIWFTKEYDLKSEKIAFNWADVKIKIPYSLWNYLKWRASYKYIISKLEEKNVKIKIHEKYFAKYSVRDFSFFPAKRYRNWLWDCAFQNYRTVLWVINWLYLKQWHFFNLNKNISYVKWYCKWITPNLPFYAWACWWAWQLFKVSLLTPQIQITKRSPHIRRRSPYYWKEIYWDDSAILDTRKQSEIYNFWQYPIYFKTIFKKKYDYLVAILPKKLSTKTYITKKQTWPLSAFLEKKVIDFSLWKVLLDQQRKSKYYEYYK